MLVVQGTPKDHIYVSIWWRGREDWDGEQQQNYLVYGGYGGMSAMVQQRRAPVGFHGQVL